MAKPHNKKLYNFKAHLVEGAALREEIDYARMNDKVDAILRKHGHQYLPIRYEYEGELVSEEEFKKLISQSRFPGDEFTVKIHYA